MTLKKKTFLLSILFFLMFRLSYAQGKFEQVGMASYYSDVFQGKRTASGEKYNKTLYTAAHATLPFHTLVKVTCIKNNLAVIVEINDRYPKYSKRIIDISKAAAKKLNMITSGIAKVKLELVADTNIVADTNSVKIILSKDSLIETIPLDSGSVKKKKNE